MTTAANPILDDDAVLVRRAVAGDVAAFRALYRAHVPRIHAVCRRMAGDAVLAEELTQSVFVRAWERLDGFRGESAFGTWLYRLAVHLVLTDRRSEARRLARVTPVEVLPDRGAGSSRDLALDLQRALDQLPPRAREVFVLFEVEGWPHEEIAAAMNTTVGTSKAQLHEARARMRRALG